MHAVRILREICVAETREVAIDAAGRPIAVRLERLADPRPIRIGAEVSGRLRSISPTQGGGFVELEDGQGEVFLRLKPEHGLTEGMRLQLRIASEPRDGTKLARAVLADEPLGFDPSLPWSGAPVEDVAPGNPEVEAAFDEILQASVTLPGGGRLTLERTRALVAADVDTSGRSDSGRAANRALKVNLDAAAELARQIRLRNLGGLIVLDCVAPINRDAGKQIRERFTTTFSAISGQSCRTLVPSELGLLQAAIAWAETPMAERLLDKSGERSAMTICHDGFRLLETEARAQPMSRLLLSLPGPALSWLKNAGGALESRLAAKYGDRFTFDTSNTAAPFVSTIP